MGRDHDEPVRRFLGARANAQVTTDCSALYFDVAGRRRFFAGGFLRGTPFVALFSRFDLSDETCADRAEAGLVHAWIQAPP